MKRDVVRFTFPAFFIVLTLFSKSVCAAEVVVHRALGQDEITLNIVRLIFTMRLIRWPDGSRVRVFVLPDSTELHREFSKQQLDLYPRQLRRVWDRNLFSGSGAVPVTVYSVEEMLRRVEETPGAIGYLPDGYATDGVRTVHVK